MAGNQLNRMFRKSRCKRNRNGAHLHRAKQHKDPLRSVLHDDADSVAWTNAPGFQFGGNRRALFKHIGIPVFLNPVMRIENESGALGNTFGPRFDLLEDPLWRESIGNRWPRHLSKEAHTDLMISHGLNGINGFNPFNPLIPWLIPSANKEECGSSGS